jgi:hypothetical protein
MSYITLGEGKSTKILWTTDGLVQASTITTTDADTAQVTARCLTRLRAEIASALYPVAVAAAGSPVEARRRLLAVFDAAVAAGELPEIADGDPWAMSTLLVGNVAVGVRGAAAAPLSAVRREVADLLVGFDGVLVPAHLSHTGYRPGVLRLVISRELAGWVDSSDWPAILADLTVVPDRGVYPIGSDVVQSIGLDDLPYAFFEADYADAAYESQSGRELAAEAGDNEALILAIPAPPFAAWLAAHDAEKFAAAAHLFTS